MKQIIYFLMLIGLVQLASASVFILDSGTILNATDNDPSTLNTNATMTFSMSVTVTSLTVTPTTITLENVTCSNGVTVTQVIWDTPNSNKDSVDTYCVSTVTIGGGGGTNPGCRLRTQACSDSYPCCEGTECVEGICWTPLGGECYSSDYCKMPQMCIDGYCFLESNETIEEVKVNPITELVEDIVSLVKDVLGIEETDEQGNVIEKIEEDGSNNNTIIFFIVFTIVAVIYYKNKEKKEKH